MSMNLETMKTIQDAKALEITHQEQQPLDAEGAMMAEQKRETFDMPINVAKVDPLR